MAYGERRQRRQDELGIPNEDALVTQAIDNGLAGDPRSQIAAAYKTHLGRDGSEQEYASHMGRGYNLADSLSTISGSEEARNYAKRPKTTTTTRTGGTSTGIPDPVNHTQPVDDPNVTTSTGGGGGARSYDYIPGAESVVGNAGGHLSGFNTAEWGPGQDTEGYDEFSYKNTFGKLASHLPPSPESVRQLVNDPQFKAMFPNAILVDHPNDPKIQFEPNDPPVDVLINSGAGGWAWQPEGPGAGVAGADGGGVALGVDGDMANSPPLTPGDDAIDALSEGDTLKKILAAIAAAGRGETPGLDDSLGKLI